MSNNQAQLLIDHLDNTLSGSASPEMDQRISDDPGMAQEWNTLRLAVDAVKEAGLYEQVGAVKSAWLAQQNVTAAPLTPLRSGTTTTNAPSAAPAGAVVRAMYRNVMRVAASILVLAVGVAVYKYTVTSSAGLYEKYYSSYELNTSRGGETQDAIGQAYAAKDWTAVTTLFNAEKEKSNKSCFLAGMSDLESKRYDEAIEKFKKIIAVNARSGGDAFQDQAEFYLAMSWLAKDDVKEAMPLLEKIRADKNHPYHDVVVRMSSLDLRIAQYKSDK